MKGVTFRENNLGILGKILVPDSLPARTETGYPVPTQSVRAPR